MPSGKGTKKIIGVKIILWKNTLTAIATKEALDIKADVVAQANELTGLFSDLTSIEMTPEIQKSIQAIALNDVMTGKESSFKSDYRMNKLSFLHEAKQKFDLSAELEAVMSADIIEGSGALAEAIDFNKQFMTMDESIRKAGNELAELQYYLTATDAQKKLGAALKVTDEKSGAAALMVTW